MLDKDFNNLIKKYGDILSLKELEELFMQLDSNGYFLEIERNSIHTKDKAGIFELYRRLKSKKLALSEAQQYMYKI